MSDLTGKKILLFSPKFFGYENSVKSKMEEMGAEVFLFDERANPSTLDKILIRLDLKKIIGKKINRYYSHIMEEFDAGYFDFVIFLNPETVTAELLSHLKQKQDRARFVLYMWDSFSNKPHTMKISPYFDSQFSFDKNDCENFNMTFRPLFFIDEYDADKNGGKNE